jgi:hypothetical protein
VEALKLKVIPLQDTWAKRKLVIAFNPQRELTPSAQLLMQQLSQASA